MGTLAVDTDPARLDLDRVHAWLAASYWSPGVAREVVERSIRGSIPFGAYEDGVQVGFARVVTDRATFAWVADVVVAPEARGKGVGKAIMGAIVAHPELQGLRRMVLATRDAHGLYAQFGFEQLWNVERWMGRR
jgi:GNAT superfamily N-acetyltransferase